MRIIAGRFGGRALTPLGKGDAKAHLRPTGDRVRESLFSLLSGGRFGDPIRDARVLDLFAGTGALGLEALSRGAAHVTFVENGRLSGKLLGANITLLNASDEVSVLRQDATRLGQSGLAPATLVFLDPPYGSAFGEKALKAARQGGWIAPGALIVWEDSVERPPPGGFEPLDARRYGDTWLTLLRLPDNDEDV